jgi:hypothetical protein
MVGYGMKTRKYGMVWGGRGQEIEIEGSRGIYLYEELSHGSWPLSQNLGYEDAGVMEGSRHQSFTVVTT